MDMLQDLILKVDKYIENYKEAYKKAPNRAIINNDVYLKLNGEFMLIPKKTEKRNKIYVRYFLDNNKRETIEVNFLDKLSEEKGLELKDLTKLMKSPVIFCCHGIFKKFKNTMPYDLSLPSKELTENTEEQKAEEKKEEKTEQSPAS